METSCRFLWAAGVVAVRVPFTKGRLTMARQALHGVEFWADQLTQQKASGLSVSEYCRREGLKLHNFYYNRRRVLASAHGLEHRPSTGQRQVTGGQAGGQQAVTRQQLADGARGTAGSGNCAARAAVIAIQWNERTWLHVPAERIDTLEAILKLTQRLAGHDGQTNAFRSVVVRS
jgi:hypothetical protein